MQLETIISFMESSPTVRLLKADQGAFVLLFLQTTFKDSDGESAISCSQDELRNLLEIFQEQMRADEHEVLVGSADRYLLAWSDALWLRRFLPADANQPHYQLTRFAEDAIRFVDVALSRDSRMVGTESRLRLVIDTLVDLVRGSSADPDQRLKQLLAERRRIDDEITAIRGGAAVETYHPAQIRERFHTAMDLLKTLQGDFRAVEDRFEAIARQVQRDAMSEDRQRGEILSSALDAEDMVKQQDEGISFDAFVSFLFSPQAQARLRETIAEVTRLEAIADQRRSIDHIRKMVPSLLREADNVLRQTGRLSQTLRRLLNDQSAGHRKRTAEVLRDIRTLAARMKQSVSEKDEPIRSDIGLRVETAIGISSPLARPFWTPPQVFETSPEAHVVDLAVAEREARKLAKLKRLEWDQMRDAIRSATQQRRSITMSQLVLLRPPKAGVIELVGWLQIAHEDGHRIDRDASEEIELTTVDEATGTDRLTRVKVPLVTFSRTENVENEPTGKLRPR